MASQIIYGRQPVAEAEGGEAPGPPGVAGARHRRLRARAPLRLPRPPGRRRRGRSLSLRGPAGACCWVRTRCWWCWTRFRDPRNLGAVCRSAEFAGAGRRDRPRAACGGSDGGRLPRPRPARSSIFPSPHVRNPSPTGSPTPRPPAFWIWGADAEAEAAPWTGRPQGFPPSSFSALRARHPPPRGSGLRRPSRASPAMARSAPSTSRPPATALLFEARRQRD